MEDFVVSKSVLNKVEFDKQHQLWRFCDSMDKVYSYAQVKKVSIIEEIQKGKKTANILNNMAGGMASTTIAQPSTYMKIRIRVILQDDQAVYCDVSEDYIMQNTLDYHEDKRKAEEIKKGLKIVEKRNRK